MQGAGNQRLADTALQQPVVQQALFNVAVVLAVDPVTEKVVAEPLAKQLDHPRLRPALDLADSAHTNRVLPVKSSCIMPCLMALVLSRRASSPAISASMSERMAAMACCSSTDGARNSNSRNVGNLRESTVALTELRMAWLLK